MTDDLVKRLRAPPLAERNEGIKIEAADEIERLRAAHSGAEERIIEAGQVCGYLFTRKQAEVIARAALGEPKP